MVTKRKTSGKTAKKGATGKRTKSRNAAECAVADDFYKTMRGCKNGTRKGSYGNSTTSRSRWNENGQESQEHQETENHQVGIGETPS